MSRLRTTLATAVAAVVVGTLGGVVISQADDTPSPAPSVTPSASASVTASPSPSSTETPTPSTPPAAANVVDTVIVIPLENHSAAQIAKGAPKITALGKRYGRAPNAVASCAHPSQPNYVCLSSGHRLVSSNTIKTLGQPDVWNGTLAAGRTTKVYVQGLPVPLAARRKDHEPYAARHVFTVPFVATPTTKANFARYTVRTSQLTGAGIRDVDDGQLPNVAAIIPDNFHNAHSKSLAAADYYIAGKVKLIQSGPQYKAGHVAIVITADEGLKSSKTNSIPMVVIHPSLHGATTTAKVSLYSLGGFLADVGHTPRLGAQRTAPDFGRAFGLVAG